MLARCQGELLDQSTHAATLGINGPTVGRYIDLLWDFMLVRRLPAWCSNVGKRLIRSPKVFVRVRGLVRALLGLNSLDAVLSHPVAGSRWEGFVFAQLIMVAPTAQASFYTAASDLSAVRKLWVAAVEQPYSMKVGIEVMGLLLACLLVSSQT